MADARHAVRLVGHDGSVRDVSLITILAVAVPPAAALLGVVVGGVMERRTAREATREAGRGQRRAELAGALADYMGVIELIAFELSRNPASSWLDRQLDRLPRGRLHYLFSTVLERVATGSRFAQLRADYYRSRAALTLVAPISIIGQVLEIDRALVTWQDATTPHELRNAARMWHDLGESLRIAGQSAVDAGMDRPYREGGLR
ncbi:MAG: hypothetical protein QOG70_422 [Solirubrobacteraceae bacterium]|nr:hypothetical protein [Solirubrobacteraceae bacterium]